ncbi:MAG: proline--tRNA ligase [Calditrichaeota bacterium]|nr:proline--tRNA ligase [Calditrichota bacterium]
MGNKKARTAISPTREEDYSGWYQSVVREADMAEMSHVRGCMVIKPWGYGIWENMQRELDRRIKATGHENAYFPLFIPLSYIEKEAAHVEGFAKEMAVVTHHRLVSKDGELKPAGELESPLVVRPTSETIIGASFANWIQSYKDLPVLINQWANVVRWEMRPRVFLRTTEFLWQEGHTVHATHEEAVEETEKMFKVYQDFVEEFLAIPVIPGEKSESERFPGAIQTFTIEAMMQDGKALQSGTSHYLGQNFAKASKIQFAAESGELEYAYTTSWGVSTRLIGALIMSHSDDDGLRVPPRIAPWHIAIVPILRNDEEVNAKIEAYCKEITAELNKSYFAGNQPIMAKYDDRQYKPVNKKWGWIKKGIPIVLEIGPRDVENGSVSVLARDKNAREYENMPRDEFVTGASAILERIQKSYYDAAVARLKEHTHTDIHDYKSLLKLFSKKGMTGFVNAKWCESIECEDKVTSKKLTIRCLPIEQSGTEGHCVVCGAEAKMDAIFAMAY